MSNHNEHRDSVSPSIAVVGVGALFPGSTNARGFWRDIMEGRDQIKEIPPNYWLIEDYYDPDPTAPDKTYGKRGAFLSEVPFDAMAFGVPPNVVQQTDTSQLLGLIVAQQVLEDAAEGDFQHVDKRRISVILGATGATELVVHLGSRLQRPIWLNALRENGIPEDEAQAICTRIADSYVPWTEASFPGLLGNVVAGRIANKFDLGGTNCVVDAACASSLSALAMGLSELHLHQADMVIVGGVDTLNDILMYMCFSKTPALSVTGDCRPFSDQADGTILGEGLGMVALRRLEDAERDGDRIYAVIRGIGSSSDGKGTAVYAPKASGQAEALRRAYAVAGYSPRTVELLEAHGTATKAGDVAEFTGASSVFAEADADEKQWCAIGSIKSQIGHTKGAAGAAALIKAVLALHHKALPPTIKVERPNATLAVAESPFYINTQARPWVRDAAHPRRASVSSFGFGGSNFHVTLEEYTGDQPRKPEFRPSPTELFVLSGANAAQIVVAAQQLTRGFDDPDSFQFLARATQLAYRTTDRTRLALVAKDIVDLQTKLDAAIDAIQGNPTSGQRSPTGWYYTDNAANAAEGKIAFLFPGQGSQYVGMGSDLALAFAKCRAEWDEAANLEFEQGGRLHDVVFPHPVFSDDDRKDQEARLRATDWAQPAIGVASLSQLALLSILGITPDAVGGHSFGEVTALYAAGVLTDKAFLAVARKRGELMAEAAAMFPGAMTAIAHAADEVTALLASWDTGVVIANHNSPDQIVISGIETAIAAAEAKLRAAGIRFQRLPVATAFHSSVVRPASAPFRTFLEHVAVHKPTLPVYANSTAAIYSSIPEVVRETLANQIAQPVRFAEQVEAMYAAGVRTFVEVGPSTVLTNLVKSCLGDRPHHAVALDRKEQHGLTSLWHGLAQLVVAGVPLQFAQLWEGVACGNDPRTRKSPKLTVNISGVNYAKPYPPAGGAAALAAPNPARRETLPTLTDKHVAKNGGMQIQTALNSMPPGNQTTTIAAPPRSEAAPTPQRTAPIPPAPAPVTPMTPSIPPPAPIRPVAPPTPAPAPSVAHDPAPALANHAALAWVGAFQELQRQTVDAHMAFLQVAEQSMRSLETMLAMGSAPELQVGAAAPPPYAPPASPAAAPSFAPSAPPPPTPKPVMATPVAQPIAQPIAQPVAQPVAQPIAAPAVRHKPAPAQDLHAVMMDVVTEKTGYPTEMLERGMALDTDLGIDSIKRVEILAAVRERVPALPEFDTTIMAGLRTLGEIVDYMDSQLASSPAPSGPPAAAALSMAPVTTAQRSPANTQDIHAVMMAVVTEKTGYPTEMLERGMALDTDLGIDSIKRVEILAAVRERVPALPEFDTTIMAGLRTLGEIVDYMDSQLAAAPAPSGSSTATALATTPVAPAPHGPAVIQDVHAVMMAVVTEKTGYPTEMLERGMVLDTDLGIDSIKRVEILAAVRERVPALPEFDTTIMAGLRTLGEIVDYMDASVRGAPVPTATAEPRTAVSGFPASSNPIALLAVAAPNDASPLRRYVLEMVPRTAPGLAPPFLIDGTTVYITDDGGGIAPALAEALRPLGAQAVVCDEVPATARAVICLAGLRAVQDENAALAVNAEAFAVATTIAAGFEATGGLFVTVQDTGGDYGLVSHCAQRAWLGGLAGLAKTAAQEWPNAVVRALDLEQAQLSPAEVAARLARELLTGAADLEIGLPADGRRISFVSVEAEAAGGTALVDAESVLVVSGGGRGVTAAAVIELAKAAHPRFALLGRSTLEDEPEALRTAHHDAALKKALLARAKAEGIRLTPKELGAAAERIQAGREIRATLHALQTAGSAAIYLTCDITDAPATAAALQTVRAQWGPITGLIHGAGVLADKRLAEKTAEDYQRVFGTKIDGLRSLLAATQEDPLTLLALFSSVAARTGNAGQADYAMANEVLNRVANAEAKRRTGCVVKSIGWGPWEGGMVTPLLKAKFDELGVPLIPLAAGARCFVAEIQQATPHEVEVVIGGMPQAAPLVNPRQAQAARPAAYDVVVSAATHPYLRSHQINGVVVVPLVLAQEWFLRAANARQAPPTPQPWGEKSPAPPQHREAKTPTSPQNWGAGGASYRTIQNLRVLKGIPLPAFDTGPTRLRIQLEPDRKNPPALKVALRDADGAVRFAAQIVQSPPPLPEPPPVGAWPTVDLAAAALYGAQLFHGPEFAALQAVDRLGATGAQATLSGSQSLGWGDDGWWSDPALIDGGLQLARIWGYECLHQLTLPTALDTFSLYLPGLFNPTTLPGRQVRCIVQGKPIGQSGTRSDLWFVDAQTGEVLAAVRGLEMYLSSEPVLAGGAD